MPERSLMTRRAGAGSGEIALQSAGVVTSDRNGKTVRLVEDCSFVAERGQFTTLVGPSGCGKTTLMNLIAGYIHADTGSVKLDDVDVRGPGWDRLMVFQETALFPWMTTLENVAYGPMVRGIKTMPEIRAEAVSLLKRFGLGEFTDRYPRELSGGMQRRAELARALINDPLVLLMDEPFRGLDAMTRQLMQEYLTRLFEETRTTTIFVTSEIDEAIFLADRLVVLSNTPARVAAVIDVDLPRPRDLSALTSARYVELKERALQLLYVEASSSFDMSGSSADLKEAFEKRREAS